MKYLLLLLATLPAFAQTATDYQLRPLYHVQLVPKSGHVGVASWGVLSDITNAHPLKCWAVGGVAFKGKTRWLEVMGGAGHFYPDARASPVLDFRFQDTSIPRLKLFMEVFCPTRRTMYWPSITTAIPIGRKDWKLWVGGEADLWWGKNPTKGGGPKLVVPLGKHFALTTAYHFNTNVLRNYFLYTF